MADKAGAIRAGGAYIELFADRGPLDKGLREAQEQVKGFGKTVGAIGAALGAVGVAIGAPIVAATKIFAESGTNLILMSKRTGYAVESLSKLSYVATETGTDLETVERSIKKFQRTIVEAGFGSNEAALHFAALGLSVQYLLRLTPEKQFEAVAEAIARLRDPTQRAGIALMIFGRTGTVLLPLIENMRELSKQAEEFGLVVSKETAESAYRLERALKLLWQVVESLARTIGKALEPAVTQWTVAFSGIIKQVKNFLESNNQVVMQVAKLAIGLIAAGGALLTLAAAARVAFAVMKVLRIAIAALHTTLVVLNTAIKALHVVLGLLPVTVAGVTALFTALISPMGVFVIALGAAAAALVYFGKGAAILTWVKEQFKSMYEWASTALEGIANALKAGDLILAVKILWANIKVVWLTGMNFLTTKWTDFKSTFNKITSHMFDYYHKAWINISAAAQTAMIKILDAVDSGINTMVRYWNVGLTAARLAFLVFADNVQTGWENLQGLFKGGVRPEVEQARAGRQGEILKTAVQAFGGIGLAAGIGGMQLPPPPNPRLAEIEQERLKALARVGELQAAADKAREKAADAAKKASEAELLDAKMRAAVLGELAKIEKAKMKVRKPEPFAGPGEFNLGEIRRAKIDIEGGFNAMALRGLGAGSSVQDEQLAAQKQMVVLLNEIARRKDRFATLFD